MLELDSPISEEKKVKVETWEDKRESFAEMMRIYQRALWLRMLALGMVSYPHACSLKYLRLIPPL